jgi:hypothetical protein
MVTVSGALLQWRWLLLRIMLCRLAQRRRPGSGSSVTLGRRLAISGRYSPDPVEDGAGFCQQLFGQGDGVLDFSQVPLDLVGIEPRRLTALVWLRLISGFHGGNGAALARAGRGVPVSAGGVPGAQRHAVKPAPVL